MSSTSTRLLHLLTTPFILALSLPVTFFALFTTLIALSALFLRASVVYFEFLLAVARSAISPSSPRPNKPAHRPTQAPTRASRRHHHRRRSSSASNGDFYLNSRPQSLASLPAGAATPRDYESVGGWRLTTGDEADDALWSGINSRLELPALTLPSPSRVRRGSVKGQGSPTSQARRRFRPGTESPEGYFSAVGGGGESPALIMTTGKGRLGEGEGRSTVSLVRLGKDKDGGGS